MNTIRQLAKMTPLQAYLFATALAMLASALPGVLA